MAPIIQKLKQQIMEKDTTIAKQQQEISNIGAACHKMDAELATLWAEHDRLRKLHITQEYELNTAKDNIDDLIDENNKAQEQVGKLMSTVQSKQNSYVHSFLCRNKNSCSYVHHEGVAQMGRKNWMPKRKGGKHF